MEDHRQEEQEGACACGACGTCTQWLEEGGGGRLLRDLRAHLCRARPASPLRAALAFLSGGATSTLIRTSLGRGGAASPLHASPLPAPAGASVPGLGTPPDAAVADAPAGDAPQVWVGRDPLPLRLSLDGDAQDRPPSGDREGDAGGGERPTKLQKRRHPPGGSRLPLAADDDRGQPRPAESVAPALRTQGNVVFVGMCAHPP